MSEFSDSYFNQAKQQEAYNDAVADAMGQQQKSQREYSKDLSKYQEKEKKEAETHEAVEGITGLVGGISTEEGIRGLLDKAGKRLAKKATDVVQKKVGDVVNDISDRATQAVSDLVDKASTKVGTTIKDLQGLPKADETGVEDLLRKRSLKRLQAQTEKKFGKTFDLAKQSGEEIQNPAFDDVKALDNARELTRATYHPATLVGEEVDDINPQDFFSGKLKGFDPSGDLFSKDVNPNSPYQSADFQKGVKDFKEFGSRADQIADEARIGDQLQPLRDINPRFRGDMRPSQIKSYEKMKSDVKAPKPKPQQVEVEEQEPPRIQETEAQPKPQPKATQEPEPDDDVATKADEGTTSDTTADATADATAGAEAGLETAGEVADTAAVAEGGLDPIADIAAVGLGLASVLGGIFGKKKNEAPPAPPPPPKPLNPAIALGI